MGMMCCGVWEESCLAAVWDSVAHETLQTRKAQDPRGTT
jgi:hypothetical protein